MTIAYWCIFCMILFPYIFTVLAKSSKKYNNRDPREYLQNTTGWRKRADYVQRNSFEMTPAFSIAVLAATLFHKSQLRIDMLSITFVISRIAYGMCYLADKARLRSFFWTIGFACIISLFFIH